MNAVGENNNLLVINMILCNTPFSYLTQRYHKISKSAIESQHYIAYTHISEYILTNAIPENIKPQLPSVEELERELEKQQLTTNP